MRKIPTAAAGSAAATLALALTGALAPSSSAAPQDDTGRTTRYIVLADQGTSTSQLRTIADSLRSQGARVTSVNTAIGLVAATSRDGAFREHAGSLGQVQGVAADAVIGHAPKDRVTRVEQEHRLAGRSTGFPQGGKKPGKLGRHPADPLDGNLWGMRMIHADGAHAVTLGNKKVTVGVIDTGVQADHPDLHPNFDYGLSRNFATDMPDIDGPCEHASCVDPVGEDDNGHGSHVAGTIAAAMNGFGVSGVAPHVRLAEVRAGQDSGYFFLAPTVNALTYAGDAGIDVVNMSFYVDPWLYNCAGGAPEDTPQEAADQDTIIAAMDRALDYAHGKGVTMLAAAGNENTDMANPGVDETSPDYPDGAAHPRTIDNARCSNLPTEGPHVLGVTALGPSERKSDYSNYTTQPLSGEVEVSAPGGWYRDGFGTPSYKTPQNEILSSVPLVSLVDSGEVDQNGNITPAGQASGIIKQCQAKPAKGTSRCGYYAWYQGTSMATPHATGVAALAVGAHGRQGRGGFGLAPDRVQELLMSTATDHACPAGGVQDYTKEGRTPDYTARCVGTTERNGFYGDGIVNALAVLR